MPNLARAHARVAAILLALSAAAGAAEAEETLDREANRIRVIRDRIAPATIAVVESSAASGGSGVIVSADGVAVTNYHVVQPCGPTMLCGMSDGSIVEAVLLGADPAGDLAAIRLLDDVRKYLPVDFANVARARVGDEVVVAGNPLLVAEDFSPSISVGVLSGKDRYQYPAGELLEYAGCLQTDAAINPGNSGGPLFDARGELLGVVGRASFEKRGRVSVGVGYAISVEQVRRFLPALVGGCVPDHGALGFTVRSATGRQTGGPRIERIDADGPAHACGLRVGDEVVGLGDVRIGSANQLMNLIGARPAHWPVAVRYRRGGETTVADTVAQPVAEFRLPRQHAAGRLYEEVRRSLAPPAKGLSKWMRHYGAAEGLANARANHEMKTRILAAADALTDKLKPPADGLRFTHELPGRTAEVTLSVEPRTLRWESDQAVIAFRRDKPYGGQPSPGVARSVVVGLAAWLRMSESARELRYVGDLPWRAGGEPWHVLRLADGDAETDFYFGAETGRRETGRLVGWTCRIAREGRETDFEPRGQSVIVRVLGEERSRLTWASANPGGGR